MAKKITDRLGDVPVPVRYFREATSINFKRSLRYGVATVGTIGRWYLHRLGLRQSPLSGQAGPLDAYRGATGKRARAAGIVPGGCNNMSWPPSGS